MADVRRMSCRFFLTVFGCVLLLGTHDFFLRLRGTGGMAETLLCILSFGHYSRSCSFSHHKLLYASTKVESSILFVLCYGYSDGNLALVFIHLHGGTGLFTRVWWLFFVYDMWLHEVFFFSSVLFVSLPPLLRNTGDSFVIICMNHHIVMFNCDFRISSSAIAHLASAGRILVLWFVWKGNDLVILPGYICQGK